jgi:hypothetical protein
MSNPCRKGDCWMDPQDKKVELLLQLRSSQIPEDLRIDGSAWHQISNNIYSVTFPAKAVSLLESHPKVMNFSGGAKLGPLGPVRTGER